MTSERSWYVTEWIALRLIDYAARRAPDSLSERLKEEWLADLAAQRGPIPRVRFVLGVCWAATVIAHQHAAPTPSSDGPTGHGHFIRFPRDDFQLFAGGTVTFLLCVSLFASVLCGLGIGLAVT